MAYYRRSWRPRTYWRPRRRFNRNSGWKSRLKSFHKGKAQGTKNGILIGILGFLLLIRFAFSGKNEKVKKTAYKVTGLSK